MINLLVANHNIMVPFGDYSLFDLLVSFNLNFFNAAVVCALVTSGKRPPLDKLPTDIHATISKLIDFCWHQDPRGRPRFSGMPILKHVHACIYVVYPCL